MTALYALTKPLLLALALGLGLALSLAGVSTTQATGPGDLDTSFNGTGFVTKTIGIQDVGYGIIVQSDGRIVVVGLTGGRHCVVLRYESDGHLDPTFGIGGVVTTAVSLDGNTCFGIALQVDGKIVVTGDSSWGISHRPALTVIRYNQDGTLDSTFNGTGVVTTAVGTTSRGNGVVVQPDGKIVVTGESNFDTLITVVRYNDDGTLDGGFGGDGIITTTANGPYNWWGSSISLQPDGKIVVAATMENLSDAHFAVIRYNQDGSLDSSFKGGVVTTSVSGRADSHYALALQTDGKIVGAGQVRYDPSSSDFIIIRYNKNGDLDTSFNGTGIVTTSIGSVGSAGAFGVALESNGKIVAIGSSWEENSKSNLALVRYNNNGSLDTGFHGTGIVTTSIDSIYNKGEAVTLQPDGKILVTGFIGDMDIAVVRYWNDYFYYHYLPIILVE